MENTLSHHGVKGMKWGVRHDRAKAAYNKTAKTVSRTSREIDSTWDGGNPSGNYSKRLTRSSLRYQGKANEFDRKASGKKEGSKAQLKAEYKRDKALNKMKMQSARAKSAEKIDKQIKDYRKAEGKGMHILKSATFNPYFLQSYDYARSQGASRGSAYTSGLLTLYGFQESPYLAGEAKARENYKSGKQRIKANRGY